MISILSQWCIIRCSKSQYIICILDWALIVYNHNEGISRRTDQDQKSHYVWHTSALTEMADQLGSTASGGSSGVVSRASLAVHVNINELMETAISGHAMASDDSRVLHGITPLGSTSLHISSFQGHKGLFRNVLELEHSLLTSVKMVSVMPMITRSRSSLLGGALMDECLLEAGTSADAESMPQVAGGPAMGPASTDSAGSPGAPWIDKDLLEAARSGNSTTLKHLFLRDPSMLLATSPEGNNCLHIASLHGHMRFCKDAIALNSSLLAAVNLDGETPLLIAITSCDASLASALINCCPDEQLRRMAILKQDNKGCNALHHAIRSGKRDLALELIREEHGLSQAFNSNKESPMFMAVRRDLTDVFEELLMISDSAHSGTRGYNALHAAVLNGNPGIVKRIMEKRPWLAREEELTHKMTPVQVAAYENKIDILKIFLESDRMLGYLMRASDEPLLCTAAFVGHVGVARVLLNYCPDAPFRTRTNGWTCLHTAVFFGQTEFAKFILGSQKLRKLINMQDESGETALHIAVRKCNPKMVAALLQHRDIDITILSEAGQTATWVLFNASADAKTLNWNEVYMLMLKADPKMASSTYNLHGAVMDEVTNALRKDTKTLSKKYTKNTSLVAILIATITFAAAFTLPGGYSNNAGNEGHPIMARKLAFQAFLISDTLAMCSSLAVAFIYITANWEDLEFLLYYRSFTKKLMWFAYMSTTTAFSTGLYTVLAPRLLWLAVAVCLLTVLLPILITLLLGEWPIWKLRFQLRQNFKSDLLDMV